VTTHTQIITIGSAPTPQMTMYQMDQTAYSFEASSLNREEVVIEFSAPQEGEITLVMLDMAGKEVRKEVYRVEDAQMTYTIRWNVSSYENGMYIIGFISSNHSETERVMIAQ
jgi:hypothetical protein